MVRNELGAFLVLAGFGELRDGALITLLALNGLRIFEALNATSAICRPSEATGRWRSCARVASTSRFRQRHGLVGRPISTSVSGPSARSTWCRGWTDRSLLRESGGETTNEEGRDCDTE